MKFERNTVIGFVILALLFFGSFSFNNTQKAEFSKKKAEEEAVLLHRQDSIAKVKERQDSIAYVNNPNRDTLNRGTDTTIRKTTEFVFGDTTAKPEQLVVVENNLL